MAEGRQRENWTHTSHVLALIANVNRDPKKTPAFEPADWNPMLQRQEESDPPEADITILKTLFVDQKGGAR